jgi:hypothetical protein
MFRWSFHPSSGAQDCTYSNRYMWNSCCYLLISAGRGQLKCDGTGSETRFRLSAKRTNPFQSAEGISSVRYWQPRSGHKLLLLVVMLDTPCSEVVRRVLATHSIRQFPLHFPSHKSPCAIKFHLESGSRQQQLFDICLFLYLKSWAPDDGRKDHPKHVECYARINNWRKQVYLVGFTVGMIFISSLTLSLLLLWAALSK